MVFARISKHSVCFLLPKVIQPIGLFLEVDMLLKTVGAVAGRVEPGSKPIIGVVPVAPYIFYKKIGGGGVVLPLLNFSNKKGLL